MYLVILLYDLHSELRVPCTAKPAERQKRRWSSKAVRAPTVQIPIKISASSTDLQQSGSTGQCSLTAFGPILILLAIAHGFRCLLSEHPVA